MRRAARTTVTVLLALTAALIPATGAASGYVEGDTGLQNVNVPPTPIVLTT